MSWFALEVARGCTGDSLPRSRVLTRFSGGAWKFGLSCVLIVCMLASCVAPMPFADEDAEILSIDVGLRLRDGTLDVQLLERLDSGADFRKLTHLLLDVPQRWEHLGGVTLLLATSHRLDCRFPDGSVHQVWIGGSTWLSAGWKLKLTEEERRWFFEEAEWREWLKK